MNEWEFDAPDEDEEDYERSYHDWRAHLLFEAVITFEPKLNNIFGLTEIWRWSSL